MLFIKSTRPLVIIYKYTKFNLVVNTKLAIIPYTNIKHIVTSVKLFDFCILDFLFKSKFMRL